MINDTNIDMVVKPLYAADLMRILPQNARTLKSSEIRLKILLEQHTVSENIVRKKTIYATDVKTKLHNSYNVTTTVPF